MEYASLVSVWWTDTVLFPQGELFGIEGPAVRFDVCIHNANPVPIFDVELLAQEPTSPPRLAQGAAQGMARLGTRSDR